MRKYVAYDQPGLKLSSRMLRSLAYATHPLRIRPAPEIMSDGTHLFIEHLL